MFNCIHYHKLSGTKKCILQYFVTKKERYYATMKKYVHRLKLMPKDDLNYMQLCQDENESTNAQNVYFRANQWMNWPLF